MVNRTFSDEEIRNICWRFLAILEVRTKFHQWKDALIALNWVGGQLYLAVREIIPEEILAWTGSYDDLKVLIQELYDLLGSEHDSSTKQAVCRRLSPILRDLISEEERQRTERRSVGIGGTPGVPYNQDTEYWVRYLYQGIKREYIPNDVVYAIRHALNMFEAREVAMKFQNKLYAEAE